MPPVNDPNTNIRDSQQRLVSPRINVSLKPNIVLVGITAVALPNSSRIDRTFILVQNQGTVPIFIGDNTVTTANGGYQLNPLSDITIPCNDTAIIYAVSSQSSTPVSVIEGV